MDTVYQNRRLRSAVVVRLLLVAAVCISHSPGAVRSAVLPAARCKLAFAIFFLSWTVGQKVYKREYL